MTLAAPVFQAEKKYIETKITQLDSVSQRPLMSRHRLTVLIHPQKLLLSRKHRKRDDLVSNFIIQRVSIAFQIFLVVIHNHWYCAIIFVSIFVNSRLVNVDFKVFQDRFSDLKWISSWWKMMVRPYLLRTITSRRTR